MYLISYYLLKKSILALFDLKSEVNAIHLIFTKKPGFLIQLTDIKAQKIDCIILDTCEIVITAFSVIDKTN